MLHSSNKDASVCDSRSRPPENLSVWLGLLSLALCSSVCVFGSAVRAADQLKWLRMFVRACVCVCKTRRGLEPDRLSLRPRGPPPPPSTSKKRREQDKLWRLWSSNRRVDVVTHQQKHPLWEITLLLFPADREESWNSPEIRRIPVSVYGSHLGPSEVWVPIFQCQLILYSISKSITLSKENLRGGCLSKTHYYKAWVFWVVARVLLCGC